MSQFKIKLLFTTLADQGPISEKHEINKEMAVIRRKPITTHGFSSLYQLFQVEIDFTFYETGPRRLPKH